jgi:hypothetical protein
LDAAPRETPLPSVVQTDQGKIGSGYSGSGDKVDQIIKRCDDPDQCRATGQCSTGCIDMPESTAPVLPMNGTSGKVALPHSKDRLTERNRRRKYAASLLPGAEWDLERGLVVDRLGHDDGH